MISLNSVLVSQLTQQYTIQALLLNINNEFYYTNYDDNLYINAIEYLSIPFEVMNIDSATNMSRTMIDIKIDNVSLIPTSIFLNDEYRGTQAVVSLALIDNNNTDKTLSYELFRGYINDVELQEEEATIFVVQELGYFNRVTLRQYNYDLFPFLHDIELKPIKWGL